MNLDHFNPKRLGPEWRNYCIYSDRYLPESAMSAEHVIPRSLGGSRATVIRCSKAINSRLGHEIDGKLANDTLIMFGRRDADARGNSGQKPKALLKRTTAWKSGELMGNVQPRYNIEVPGGNQSAIVYDTRTGKYLPPTAFNDTGFVFTMNTDSEVRSKFLAKTLLGMGWKLFGESFLSTEPIGSLRWKIGTRDNPGTSLYYLDQFTIGENSPVENAFQRLQDQVTRPNRTTALVRHTEFGLEWSMSCVGHFVGSLIYPTRRWLLPTGVAMNGGLLVTVARDRLLFESVEPFSAPWAGAGG
ncbi:MAG: HNH endonuclease [Bradyrhizobium sp.]